MQIFLNRKNQALLKKNKAFKNNRETLKDIVLFHAVVGVAASIYIVKPNNIVLARRKTVQCKLV